MTKPKKTPTKTKVSKSSSLKTSLVTNNTEIKVNSVEESFFGKIINKIAAFFGGTRDWLNINKVFFETVAALLLSGMAIILSYWQWQTSSEQTKYLEQQITIERAQALPQFVIIQEGIDINSDIVNKEKLLIYNQGNIAREIDILYIVFFGLASDEEGENKKLSIPIRGYYKKPVLTQNSTGLVASTDNEAVFENIAKIENEILRLNQETNSRIRFYIGRNIEIYYKDIFNNTHIDYFYLNPVYGPELLSDAEWRDLQIKYTELKLAPDFSTITTKEVLNIFEEYGK